MGFSVFSCCLLPSLNTHTQKKERRLLHRCWDWHLFCFYLYHEFCWKFYHRCKTADLMWLNDFCLWMFPVMRPRWRRDSWCVQPASPRWQRLLPPAWAPASPSRRSWWRPWWSAPRSGWPAGPAACSQTGCSTPSGRSCRFREEGALASCPQRGCKRAQSGESDFPCVC